MKKSQDLKLKMARSVGELFNTNGVWRENEMIEASLNQVRNICGEIDQAAVLQQQNDTKGYTANRDEQRMLLEDRMFMTGSRAKVFAIKTGNNVVLKLASFSRTTLSQMSITGVITKARALVDTIGPILGELEPYSIKEADILELQEIADRTEELGTRRDGIRNTRTENTAHLKVLFKHLRAELKLLDTIVEAYIDDMEFKRTYFIARRLHDPGGRKN